MSGLEYTYIIQPSQYRGVDGNPLSCIFEIYCSDDLLMQGRVDWQNGIHLSDAEGIEAADFSRVMACALEAIKECRKLLEPSWSYGGQGEPA